jgi:hypothetical protein
LEELEERAEARKKTTEKQVWVMSVTSFSNLGILCNKFQTYVLSLTGK